MAASQLDDNMIPGATYTFQLKLGNLITLPSTSTIQNDLTNNAPSFLGSLQVTIAPTTNPLSNIFNVQFTYNGDGSDVISDVANSIIAAISQGSNDSFSFIAAYSGDAGSLPTSGITDTINKAVQSATQTITDAASSITKQAGSSAQDILTPIELAVGIVAVLVIVLIFTAGKSGGASASAEGVSVGG